MISLSNIFSSLIIALGSVIIMQDYGIEYGVGICIYFITLRSNDEK